jgi:hypothetical protein
MAAPPIAKSDGETGRRKDSGDARHDPTWEGDPLAIEIGNRVQRASGPIDAARKADATPE